MLMVVTIGGEEQLCSLTEKLNNGAGQSVFLAKSAISGGRKGAGMGQKGQFGWNKGKVRTNRLWVLGRGSRTEKVQATCLLPAARSMCRKLPLFHFLPLQKKSQPPLPPFVCAQLPGQRLQLGIVYPALVRLSNSRCAASPLLPTASDTVYSSATLPKCDLVCLHSQSICWILYALVVVTALSMFHISTQFISSSVPIKKKK